MVSITSYEANQKIIDHFAWRVMRRLQAAGARAVELSDVKQELAIVWLKSSTKWNPNKGVPFAPYLVNGMKKYINHWCQKEIGASHFANFSLDATLNDEIVSTAYEAIPCSAQSIEDSIIEKDLRQKVLRKLSARARQFILILESPPEEVVEVFRGVQAKAAYARSLGLLTFVSSTIPSSLIFDLMGANGIERASIRKEIEQKGKRLE